jgi:hypothetical protein
MNTTFATLNFGGFNGKNVGSHNGNHPLCTKTQNKHEQKKMKKERGKGSKMNNNSCILEQWQWQGFATTIK